MKVVLVEQNKIGKWLAEALGKYAVTVSRWRTNEMRPSLETLIKIANVLNVDIKDLLISTKKQYGIMYISKVSFVNYKNFVNAIVYLNKGINTIIDKNDSGKTNLFRAILLLEDASIQYAYKLTKNNFEQKLGNGKEIKLLSDYII